MDRVDSVALVFGTAMMACQGGTRAPPAAESLPLPAPVSIAGPHVSRDVPPELPALVPVEESPPPGAIPRVEITQPKDGAALGARAAARVRVLVKSHGWMASGQNRKVALVLDDYRVRYLDAKGSVTLGDLVPADRSLTKGWHRLLAIAADASGILLKPAGEQKPYGLVKFWIGEKPGSDGGLDEPALVYVEPQGTYNGPEAAAAARLDFYLLGAEKLGEGYGVRARIARDGAERVEQLRAWTAYRIEGLKSGDYQVLLTLVAPKKTPVSDPPESVGRTITVNLDAPKPD